MHLLSENKVFAFHVYGNRKWTKLHGIVLFIFFPSATERKISGERPEIRKMPLSQATTAAGVPFLQKGGIFHRPDPGIRKR